MVDLCKSSLFLMLMFACFDFKWLVCCCNWRILTNLNQLLQGFNVAVNGANISFLHHCTDDPKP